MTTCPPASCRSQCRFCSLHQTRMPFQCQSSRNKEEELNQYKYNQIQAGNEHCMVFCAGNNILGLPFFATIQFSITFKPILHYALGLRFGNLKYSKMQRKIGTSSRFYPTSVI